MNTSTTWEDFCTHELAIVRPILARLGYTLEEHQVHLGGERAVISGKKLVLLGYRTADTKRVVIKVSTDPAGKNEMQHERTCRTVLDKIQFAYHVFLTPEQLVWHEEHGCLISITPFLEQDCAFLERPLKEQFFFALNAFKTQESSHATTFEHARMVRGTFGIVTTQTYLKNIAQYRRIVVDQLSEHPEVGALLTRAETALREHRLRIEQYNGFLTHSDFVPHNFRIVDHDIYLLDHSSIRFGNKYDGWARFLNFMLLHHRELEQALITYIKQNRAPEEYEALELMRQYRFAELIWYYTNRLQKTQGDLHLLDEARILFWADALRASLDSVALPESRIKAYQELRDGLRSVEEKKRQQGLH